MKRCSEVTRTGRGNHTQSRPDEPSEGEPLIVTSGRGVKDHDRATLPGDTVLDGAERALELRVEDKLPYADPRRGVTSYLVVVVVIACRTGDRVLTSADRRGVEASVPRGSVDVPCAGLRNRTGC